LTAQRSSAPGGDRATGANAWRREEFSDAAAMQALAARVRASFPDLDMNYDIEWISVAHDWPRNELLVLAEQDGDKVSGLAAFLISNAPLVYSMGGFVFLKPRVRQFKLYQSVVSKASDTARSIGACFAALSTHMGAGNVAFLGAVPTGSDLHRQLVERGSELSRYFYALAWGGESQHCRIRWEGSVEKYLASIGKKSGKELQRNAKNLMGDPSLKCTIRRFQTPDEVDIFLRDGISVSDKTYQKRDLGLGISMGGAVERVIRFAASRGGFFGYILYINDVPAAFRYGFLCGRTCTMKQTGYDPAWADRQIGSVLFFEVLRNFEQIGLPAECLDFMPDPNLFKLRTANDRQPIRHFYLFKRNFAGTVQYLSLYAVDFLSRKIGGLVKQPRSGEMEKYVRR
jgi:Acetyltransferase (GNAT) domain